MVQLDLDISVETFSEREKLLIKHLRAYRTIDVEIELQRRKVQGIGLLNEPRITAAAPERDYLPMLKHMSVKQSAAEREIVATVEKYVSPDEFRMTYATSSRVANKLRQTFANDADEDALLQDAYGLLTERHRETFDEVKLTDTEQVAEKRLQERARAAEVMYELITRKDIIRFALEQMERWEPEQYRILWHRYVMGKPYNEVCKIVTRRGEHGEAPLTPDEYRLARNKALKQFDKWSPGLV